MTVRGEKNMHMYSNSIGCHGDCGSVLTSSCVLGEYWALISGLNIQCFKL